MRTPLIGIALLALCVGCNRADMDITTPGAVCEVHNIPLQEGVVPITYGLIRPTGEETEARRKLFPHAWSSYHDGCVVKEAKWARVSFCPECRKAEIAWKQAEQQRMAPIKAHWERVRAILEKNPKFDHVHPFIRRGSDATVGIEGQVKSDEDLAELKALIDATEPPTPVCWEVQIGS